ncbi:annulin-like protein, partial [Dinothrombium tinctorium]
QDQLQMNSDYKRQYDPHNENIIYLLINTDAVETPIGEWWLSIGYELAPNNIEWGQEKMRIILLFNPWLKEDPVYVNKLNEEELDSYVLQERGQIYKFLYSNSAMQPHDNVPWLYNQFKTNILDIVLLVLKLSKTNAGKRTSPFEVARTLSNMA